MLPIMVILGILSLLDITSIMNFGWSFKWAYKVVTEYPAFSTFDCSQVNVIDYTVFSRLQKQRLCIRKFSLKGNRWVFIAPDLYTSIPRILMMFANLQFLDLSHCRKITTLAFLQSVPKLKALILHSVTAVQGF